MLLYSKTKSRPKYQAIMKAVKEMHLLALLLFFVTYTALSLAVASPSTTAVLCACLSAYVTAILCVVADRAIV